MKSQRTTIAGVSRQLYAVVVVLVVTTLACGNVAPEKTHTPIPHIGIPVYGVSCQPTILAMLHGETNTIAVADTGGLGRVTEFKLGTVAGTASDPAASEIKVSQQPAPNGSGWSTLPGTIQIVSTAIDGPERIETYYINILVGGGQGSNTITGGNIWCQVDVRHLLPTQTPSSTPTPTSTPTPSASPTPTNTATKPPFIITGNGYRVLFIGPWQAQTSGTLAASFQVTGPDGRPAKGIFYATLGSPPTDPKASHANGQLDLDGRITLMLDVKWPAGITRLYFNFDDATYEVGEITILP